MLITMFRMWKREEGEKEKRRQANKVRAWAICIMRAMGNMTKNRSANSGISLKVQTCAPKMRKWENENWEKYWK